MNVRFLCAGVIAAGLHLSPQLAFAQRAAAPAAPAPAEQLVLRVYQLGDMILPLPNHGYRPEDLPATPAGKSSDDGRPGALGGFGGGGGGFGGGAPFNVQAGGFGGGQAGGQGGGIVMAAPPSSRAGVVTPAESSQLAMNEIAEMIRTLIEPNTWDGAGGPGLITDYRTLLVVSQTAAVHEKIAAFLDMLREKTGTLRSVTVAAYWLLLDSDQLAELQVERDGVTSIDRNVMANLTKDANSYRGQITCFSGQTVHLVGGQRRNVVTSVIPVVGGGVDSGYQPRGGTPNMGVLLQVRPTLVADASAAIVDLESWVTAAPKKDTMIDFYSARGDTYTAPPEQPVKRDSATVRVDRLDIASQALATTLRAPVGTPVLVGGLSVVSTGPAEAGERKQLYLVVQVNVADYKQSAEKLGTRPEK